MRSPAFSRLVGVLVLSFTATGVHGQATPPNVVEFLPPPEHSLVLSSGQPVVSRYELLTYVVGSTDPFARVDLGKPSRQADGMIRVDIAGRIASWPSSPTGLEARVAAIGPAGISVSAPSDAFLISDPPPAPAADTYLSALPWNVIANGWGPPERDRSNGEQGAADGRTLTLNGVTFAKGLGVHAASDIRFGLGGACSSFKASIGVDDEVGSRGSVVFEVWADGQRLFASSVMTGSTATRDISVDVKNRQELALRVTDGGDGISFDHADWANARIECGGSATYLSDMTWTAVSNGWGPAERDRSNGEQGAGDGGPITLGRRTYQKGLGVHAASEIRYALNGACSLFQADVGVDDEVGAAGSVVFQVLADGVLLFSSGTMTGASATRTVSLDIAGRRELALRVLDGGDGFSYDHADWANARVTCASAGWSYLSDRTWTAATNGWGPVERDRSNGETGAGDGRVITLEGRTYTKGLGVHANSTVRYPLNGMCSTFAADVGVDDEVGANGSVTFQVWADGRLLFDSGLMRGTTPTRQVTLDIAGAVELALVVTDGGDGFSYDHADWAGARVSCQVGS